MSRPAFGTARPWKRFQVSTCIPDRVPDLTRHFLTGEELDSGELARLLDRAAELKAAPRSSHAPEGRALGLVFERPSTRTRLRLEAGIVDRGGHPILLRSGELQLPRGESLGH